MDNANYYHMLVLMHHCLLNDLPHLVNIINNFMWTKRATIIAIIIWFVWIIIVIVCCISNAIQLGDPLLLLLLVLPLCMMRFFGDLFCFGRILPDFINEARIASLKL